MPKHEFGIMQKEPMSKELFNTYKPKKYNCIVIDDVFIESILIDLQSIECYWHTLQKPAKGLAYYGITLISPKSIDKFISILLLQDKVEYVQLISLFNKTKENNKYIIHFGI